MATKKTAKKKPAKKAAKKTAARKAPAKKASAKKASTKKAAKASAKPASSQKASAKKASTKKASTKKASAKKGSAKRATSPQERVMHSLKKDFGKAWTAVTTEVDRAVDVAIKKLPKHGIVDEEKLNRARTEFADKMTDVRERLKEARGRVAEASADLQVEERARTAADTGITALHGLVSSLRTVAERVEEALDERRPYFTSEIVDGGRYACRECGEIVAVRAGKVLPACDGCGGKKFKHVG